MQKNQQEYEALWSEEEVYQIASGLQFLYVEKF